MNDKLLTYAEAAQMLNRKVSTLKDWVKDRKIPAVYLDGARNAIGFRRATLERIISNDCKRTDRIEGGK